jgi:hypothetical protein
MQTPRDTIYSTLFTRLQTIAGIVSFTRRPITYAKYGPEQLPALLMVQRRETPRKPVKGAPTQWSLEVEVLMYFTAGGDVENGPLPASILNPYLDALEAIVEPDANMQFGNWLGLAGIEMIRFNKPTEIYEGLDSQSEVIAGLEIIAL